MELVTIPLADLGHTRLATTTRYVKVSLEREREMAEKL